MLDLIVNTPLDGQSVVLVLAGAVYLLIGGFIVCRWLYRTTPDEERAPGDWL